MNEKKTKDLIESLHADKWLELSECEALSGMKRRILKRRCILKQIGHYNYGGRCGIKIQWRDLKAYMDSHRVSSVWQLPDMNQNEG